ncbi:hypothetical protein TGRUB_305760B, partial [Toxoplasma gondii RUB]
ARCCEGGTGGAGPRAFGRGALGRSCGGKL